MKLGLSDMASNVFSSRNDCDACEQNEENEDTETRQQTKGSYEAYRTSYKNGRIYGSMTHQVRRISSKIPNKQE